MIRSLVTGSAGFVGQHLVALLKDEGMQVFEFNLRNGQDIRNYELVRNTIDAIRPNYIFHLAAQALVEDAYINPKYTLDNNILSTINILETVRINPQIKGLVVASSDKAYGKLKSLGKYTEDYPLSGDHPYDTSKSVTDLISTTYYKTYKIPVVVTRFGNIYGEGDLNFSRIIKSAACSS